MKDVKNLYSGSGSFKWMEEESKKLMNLLGPEYEGLAATGGELISDIFGSFPELRWDHLVSTFLKV